MRLSHSCFINTIILYCPFLNAHLLKIYAIIIIIVVNVLGSFGHDPADYLFAWGSFTAVLLIFIQKIRAQVCTHGSDFIYHQYLVNSALL